MTASRPPSLAALVADARLRRMLEAPLADVPAGAPAAETLTRPTLTAAMEVAAEVIAEGFQPFGQSLPGLWRVAEEWMSQALLSARVHNALRRAQVRTWGDLAGMTVVDLYDIRHFGPLSVQATAFAATHRVVALALGPPPPADGEPALAGVRPLHAGRPKSSARPPRGAGAALAARQDSSPASRPAVGAYAGCPSCQLVVPLDELGEPAEGGSVVADPRACCSVCGHGFDGFAATLPLGLRVRCGGCQEWFRAPAQAALTRCPWCACLRTGPYADAAAQASLARNLAERERVSRMVARLLRQLEPDAGLARLASEVLDPLRRQVVPLRPRREAPATSAADEASGPAVAEPVDPGAAAARLGAALAEASRWLANPRQRLAVTMRYGLDGEAAHTYAEIGQRLGYSPARARQQVRQALGHLRSAGSLARLAGEAVRERNAPGGAARVRQVVTTALPGTPPAVAAELLLRLASADDAMDGRERRAFCAAVAAADAEPGPWPR